jgi:hypothetical protein
MLHTPSLNAHQLSRQHQHQQQTELVLKHRLTAGFIAVDTDVAAFAVWCFKEYELLSLGSPHLSPCLQTSEAEASNAV